MNTYREKPYTHGVLAAARLLYKLLFRWTVVGAENVPSAGPLLVVANHVHLADPILLMLSLPRWVTFMAKVELFENRALGRLLRDAGMFPVARGGDVRQKRDILRQAEDLLITGHVLAIFPEGSRSRSGVLQEAKGGAAILAVRAGVPIVPMAIDGTERLHGVGWLFRRPRIRVTIGPAFRLQSESERLPRSELSRLTAELMRHIAELLPQDRQGPYAG